MQQRMDGDVVDINFLLHQKCNKEWMGVVLRYPFVVAFLMTNYLITSVSIFSVARNSSISSCNKYCTYDPNNNFMASDVIAY
jgi:hypothetical protein